MDRTIRWRDAEIASLHGLAESAWGLIANANEGNWERATPEWRAAAERWRDAYHAAIALDNDGST